MKVSTSWSGLQKVRVTFTVDPSELGCKDPIEVRALVERLLTARAPSPPSTAPSEEMHQRAAAKAGELLGAMGLVASSPRAHAQLLGTVVTHLLDWHTPPVCGDGLDSPPLGVVVAACERAPGHEPPHAGDGLEWSDAPPSTAEPGATSEATADGLLDEAIALLRKYGNMEDPAVSALVAFVGAIRREGHQLAAPPAPPEPGASTGIAVRAYEALRGLPAFVDVQAHGGSLYVSVSDAKAAASYPAHVEGWGLKFAIRPAPPAPVVSAAAKCGGQPGRPGKRLRETSNGGYDATCEGCPDCAPVVSEATLAKAVELLRSVAEVAACSDIEGGPCPPSAKCDGCDARRFVQEYDARPVVSPVVSEALVERDLAYRTYARLKEWRRVAVLLLGDDAAGGPGSLLSDTDDLLADLRAAIAAMPPPVSGAGADCSHCGATRGEFERHGCDYSPCPMSSTAPTAGSGTGEGRLCPACAERRGLRNRIPSYEDSKAGPCVFCGTETRWLAPAAPPSEPTPGGEGG